MTQQTKFLENILQFVAVFLGLILLNIYSNKYFFQIDLTEEKRYTIADATKKALQNLDEVVFIEIYLDGDLNSGFKRLQKSVRETLDQFRNFAGDKIQYKFVNPDEAGNQKERNAFYQQLIKKGIQPTQLFDQVEGKKIQKIIFPAAMISYQQQEKPLLLLKGNKNANAQEQLNQSIEGLEFEFANAIRALSQKNKKNIGIVSGHDEPDPKFTADFVGNLQEQYVVEKLDLQNAKTIDYDALIIAQPKKRFSDIEKFKLDQYIMKGGKTLFFLDMVQMNLDSIPMGGTYAFGYDLNLSDLLFKYGIRANMDLVQDTQSGKILLNVGNLGDRANLQAIPFPYYVVLNTFGKHPIVRNLNGVYGRFLGTLDTVRADGIKKTPLIFSNKYSKIKKIPNMISLDELRADLNPKLYNRQFLPVSYLLEGKFQSLYKNRFPPDSVDGKGFLADGKPNKMIICADGDIITNEIDRKTGKVLPLGTESVDKLTYSNKDFVLNALSYLLDEDGLIMTRNNEITLRPLDKFKIQEEKLYWQTINLLFPVVLVIVFGIAWYWLRKKRYENF